MARRNKSKILSNQKEIVNKMMKLTGSRNFFQLERTLGLSQGVITYIYQGKRGITPFVFIRFLAFTDLTVNKLCEILEIDPVFYE